MKGLEKMDFQVIGKLLLCLYLTSRAVFRFWEIGTSSVLYGGNQSLSVKVKPKQRRCCEAATSFLVKASQDRHRVPVSLPYFFIAGQSHGHSKFSGISLILTVSLMCRMENLPRIKLQSGKVGAIIFDFRQSLICMLRLYALKLFGSPLVFDSGAFKDLKFQISVLVRILWEAKAIAKCHISLSAVSFFYFCFTL